MSSIFFIVIAVLAVAFVLAVPIITLEHRARSEAQVDSDD